MASDNTAAAYRTLHMDGIGAKASASEGVGLYSLEIDRDSFYGMVASCALCVQIGGNCADYHSFGKTS